MDRTLLRGGIVLTSDPALGVLWPGDVLIEGDRIAAVGPSLQRGRRPGHRRHRPHRHAGLRRHPPPHLAVDRAHDRLRLVAHRVPRGPALRAVQALPARGHLRRQPPRRPRGARLRHHDARRLVAQPVHPGARRRRGPGAAGHRDARGLRARRRRAPVAGAAALRRAAPRGRAARPRQYFASNDGLVTMALALRGPQFATEETNRGDFALANDLDLRVTVHVGDGDWGKSGRSRSWSATGCCPTAPPTSTATRWATTSWT